MKQQQAKKIFLLIVGLLFIVWGIVKLVAENDPNLSEVRIEAPSPETDISELTSETAVVEYVQAHGFLPDYYITKEKARQQGWVASEGNLCDILPGRAIGGDRFGNRERRLPQRQGRVWYEADLNYNCGRRGAHRILFSNDGLVFVSRDHYQTFEKK